MSRLALAALVLSSACVRVDRATRVERGPLLRTFNRDSVPASQLEVALAVQWPALNLAVTRSDTCRREVVEEYAEERITESSSTAAGAALATGASATLAAGVLLGASFLVSGAPDFNTIDAAGRFGPSLRQQVQLASGIAAGIGVPALVAGLIALLRTGVETEVRRTEQVASSSESRCHVAGVEGRLQLRHVDDSMTVAKPLAQSQVQFGASEVNGAVVEVLLDGEALRLDETAQHTLEAFSVCIKLEAEKVEMATISALQFERLALCREVRPDLTASLVQASDVLERRQATGALDAFPTASRARTFEEAMAATRPTLTLAVDSLDLARLDSPELIAGQAAMARGVLEGALAPNIGVLKIGSRSLFLFVPVQKAWGGDFSAGTRVEAVVVLAGKQTVGERTLPLARVIWLRPGF